MDESLEPVIESVIERCERDGPQAAGALIWELERENQVRVCIELYNRRQLEPLLATIAEGFVHDMRPTGIPGMELYRGPEGYRRFLRDWLDAFPDSHLEIESIETAGSAVLTVVHQEVKGASSGVPVSFPYSAVLTFSAGRAGSSEFHTDLDAARARFEELAAPARR